MSRNSAGPVSQSHFARAPMVQGQRSTFDRSSNYKTTFDAGDLIPFYVEEILPGDTMKMDCNILARLATPIFPYMDNVYMDVHFFFVPNRLTWENWERFNGAQDNPDDSTDFLVPQLDDATFAAGFTELSLMDYFGLPTKVANIPQDDMPNAMPFRAYNLIWNEWYRDENLQDSVEVPKDDGPDTYAYAVLKRGRRKDYFTSALPWPQKGPSVLMPLGTVAPVRGIGKINGTFQSGPFNVFEYEGDPATYSSAQVVDGGAANTQFYVQEAIPGGGMNIWADLADATAASINEWRQAMQLQAFFEKDARGGTRYVEYLLSHWGVISPDFRLQRPEFLGGGTLSVNVNPIAQTSQTDTDSPQGNLAAFATVNGRKGFSHSFVEHGYVIGIVSVRADTTYQQGMDRLWSRRTRFDFADPLLAHLGEQPILNKELLMRGPGQPAGQADNDVFGYQERFAEYRYSPSKVTGLFRSNASASLDPWHLAIDLAGYTTLEDLVVENPPIDRIIAVPSEPQFIFDSFRKVRHSRRLPMYGVPSSLSHF